MFRRSWSPISRLRLPTPRWESTKQGFQGLLPNSSSQKILTVSLVGRPNTGKSTLFNRLTKSNKAIVSNIPGTTRDRAEGKGYVAGVPIKVYDTGGLDDRGQFIGDVVNQVGRAIAQSDLILFLLDARTGVTATDRKFATWVRETMAAVKQERLERYSPHPTKILLVANKTEGAHSSDFVVEVVSDSFGLGFGEPLLISAIHGDGMGDLGLEVLKLAREYNYDDGETQPHLMQTMPNIAADPQGSSGLASATAVEDSQDDSIDSFMEDQPESHIPVFKPIELAIMGKPNVGKSTLLNAFIGEDRVITGATPGLTRDSIQVEWTFEHRPFRLIDTAGLTRLRPSEALLAGVKEQQHLTLVDALGRDAANQKITLPGSQEVDIEEDPSQFSAQIAEYALLSALQTLKFTNVVMLVVEATQGQFSKVDLQLARKCLDEGRGLFIAANKVDLLLKQGMTLTQYEKQVKEHAAEYFREFGSIPVVACSGLDNRSLPRLLRTATRVHDSWDRRISTGLLNAWLREVNVTAPKARVGDKQLKVKYITQVKSRPPTFTLFCNADELPTFFERYLRSKIQDEFKLEGVPIRFVVKKSEGNEVKKHLLKQGKHSRRGTGLGEAKGKLGPEGKKNRRTVDFYAKHKSRSDVEQRRRRDTRLRKKRGV